MNENFRLSDIVIFSLDESASQPASQPGSNGHYINIKIMLGQCD